MSEKFVALPFSPRYAHPTKIIHVSLNGSSIWFLPFQRQFGKSDDILRQLDSDYVNEIRILIIVIALMLMW